MQTISLGWCIRTRLLQSLRADFQMNMSRFLYPTVFFLFLSDHKLPSVHANLPFSPLSFYLLTSLWLNPALWMLSLLFLFLPYCCFPNAVTCCSACNGFCVNNCDLLTDSIVSGENHLNYTLSRRQMVLWLYLSYYTVTPPSPQLCLCIFLDFSH